MYSSIIEVICPYFLFQVAETADRQQSDVASSSFERNRICLFIKMDTPTFVEEIDYRELQFGEVSRLINC